MLPSQNPTLIDSQSPRVCNYFLILSMKKKEQSHQLPDAYNQEAETHTVFHLYFLFHGWLKVPLV